MQQFRPPFAKCSLIPHLRLLTFGEDPYIGMVPYVTQLEDTKVSDRLRSAMSYSRLRGRLGEAFAVRRHRECRAILGRVNGPRFPRGVRDDEFDQ